MSEHPTDPSGPETAVAAVTSASASLSSGRSWRGVVSDSGLPAEIQALIRRVVRSAGGTGRERRETAFELVSHFAAALESDASIGVAIASFGDERSAARLLRRAIRRKRGLLWRGWWWASRAALAGFICCLALYAWWTALLLSARPTVRVNYIARIEELAAERVTLESGWPLLRDAYAQLRTREKELVAEYAAAGSEADVTPLASVDPANPLWALDERAIAASDAEIRQLHQASMKDSVAPPFNRFDQADHDFYGQEMPAIAPLGPVHDLRLPHLSPTRACTRWLAADALHAFHRGDRERALASVASIFRIGERLHGSLLVEQLVAQAIAARGLTLAVALADFETRESASQPSRAFLDELTRQVESIDLASHRIRLDAEDLAFEDSLQRFFTDDGNGDGRVTREGLHVAAAYLDSASSTILAPAAMAFTPSRAELHRAREVLSARTERFASLPPWRWADAYSRADLSAGTSSSITEFVRSNQAFWFPAVMSAGIAFSQLDVHHDRARLALALCRYRALTGDWPEQLDVLVPEYIDAIPPDPFDGQPVRYARRDGVPTVWVIGPDRVDQSLPPGSELCEDASWTNRLRDALERRWAEMEGRSAVGDSANQPALSSDDIQLWPARRVDAAASAS